MNIRQRWIALTLALLLAPLCAWQLTARVADGPQASKPIAIQSVAALTFAPDGTLFLADPYGAAIFAVAIEDEVAGKEVRLPDVRALDQRIASLLGTTPDRVRIHDLAVHPRTENAFVSVSRGNRGSEGENNKSRRTEGSTSHLIRITPSGELGEVALATLKASRYAIPDPFGPEERSRHGYLRRVWTVLDLGFAGGTLYASGISNEVFGATLLRIPYPFDDRVQTNRLRIFHTAHGRYETDAMPRVFVPYEHSGETRLFAGFSCTPLVDIRFGTGPRGERIEGRTVAELGAGNHVLDMVKIERGNKRYVLLANHLHPAMLFDLDDVPGGPNLSRPTNGAGIERTPLSDRHIERFANLGDDRVLFLQRPEGRDGRVDLHAIEVASLPLS